MKMKKIKTLMLAFALVTASVVAPLTVDAKNTPTEKTFNDEEDEDYYGIARPNVKTSVDGTSLTVTISGSTGQYEATIYSPTGEIVYNDTTTGSITVDTKVRGLSTAKVRAYDDGDYSYYVTVYGISTPDSKGIKVTGNKVKAKWEKVDGAMKYVVYKDEDCKKKIGSTSKTYLQWSKKKYGSKAYIVAVGKAENRTVKSSPVSLGDAE